MKSHPCKSVKKTDDRWIIEFYYYHVWTRVARIYC